MLIDELELVLAAGHGGPGKVSFVPSRNRKGGPDGGNGGKGGNIYIIVSSDLSALNRYAGKKAYQAEDGQMGGNNKRSGADGQDLELVMPVGVELTDQETGEIVELNTINEKVLICQGGIGGRGNFELRSSRNTTPMTAQKGRAGETKHLQIKLKLIADFGLIGLPNAGKSSLLNELTNANVKVANYPFTTLEPNLGVIEGKILADIPGLIEGASEGKGLGMRFLKHIEKVKILLHCISSESTDLLEDYQIVRQELGKYQAELLDKPEVVILTKSDLIDQDLLQKKIKTLSKVNKTIIPASIHNLDQINLLRKNLLTSSHVN